MRFAGGQMNDFLMRKENFQNIGQQGREERARQIANAFENEALIASTGLQAQAHVAAAEHMAEATRAQGAAQGQASMFSGLASGIGSIAGGLNFGGTPQYNFNSPTWQTAQTEANNFFRGAMG